MLLSAFKASGGHLMEPQQRVLRETAGSQSRLCKGELPGTHIQLVENGALGVRLGCGFKL